MTGVMEGQTTVDEAVVLDGPVPVDTQMLRDRIGRMDSAARDQLIGNWGVLPNLSDEDSYSVLLAPDAFAIVEAHIARHEPLATGLLAGLQARFAALPLGPRLVVQRRIAHNQLDPIDFTDPTTFTLGRAMMVGQILNETVAGVDQQVNEALGALPAPGDIVTTPVADAAALADVIDWPSLDVPGVVAAVAAHPERAGEALAAEHRRPKPRKGVLDKLAPLAGGDAVLPPAPAPAVPAAEPSGEVISEGASVRDESPAASPVLPSDGGWTSARPAPSDASPTTATPDAGVASSSATPADDKRMPPLKFAAILGRLGAEMLTVAKEIQRYYGTVDL